VTDFDTPIKPSNFLSHTNLVNKPLTPLQAVNLVPVDHMDEVLKKALVVDDPADLFKPAPPPVAQESVYAAAEQPEIQAH
jgi:hypothetical protein